MSDEPLLAAARALAAQDGAGVGRETLVGLAATPLRATLHRGDPVVVIVRGSRDPRFDSLTPREREVAELLAAGLANREIADRLVLSVATVKDHVHHILVKSGLPGRAAVAAAWHG